MVGKKRNFGLDVARAISIIFVLIAHKYALPVELGIVGVQIFFILSGFLIGQILIKDFNNEGKISTVFKFWKRRWYRTLPLYYLILTLKILIYGNPFGWKMIVYYLFLQANFVGVSFFGVSWSLVVEEWFYIFLPLSTLVFFRKGIDPKKFIVYLICLIFFFLSVRFLWNFYQKGVIIYQFDCLLLGVLLALLKMYYRSIYEKLNSFLLFLLGAGGVAILTHSLGLMTNVYLYDTFYKVFWYFIISVFVVFMIPWLEQSEFLNISVKKIKPLYFFFTWTSVLTYSIYLIHMEVFHIDFNLHPVLTDLFQMGILYGISFIVYSLYEHPVMTLRDELSVKHYFDSVRSFSFKI